MDDGRAVVTRAWVLPALCLLALPLRAATIPRGAAGSPADTGSGEPAYWVSNVGRAAWQACRSTAPLDGAAACALATASANAEAGDVVLLRGGDYVGQEIRPAHSGASESERIIFRRYGEERVTIRDSSYGIYLDKKSFITVHGIRFLRLKRFFRIYGGHHNTIEHCDFDTRSPESGDWVGARVAKEPDDLGIDGESATHNWIHHCTFHRWAYGAYDEHRGALLDIGSSDGANPEDRSSYNRIEDNVFAYGGHHTLGVYSKHNVIRGNYFHNETNPQEWSFEGYRAVLTEGPYAGDCLYEDNRFGFAGASGLALRSSNNILRRNVFYRNGSGAIQVVASQADVDRADANHIYHNTFYRNGHLATDPGFQGGMYFANWSGRSPIGNVVMNNVFFDNKNGAVSYEGEVEPQQVASNWDRNAEDPGFVDLADNGPMDPTRPDLRLVGDSAAIDAAAPLTSITSADGTGTAFAVRDAGFFTGGWAIVAGDRIQLANGQRAHVILVDHETNSLTVDRALTWSRGMGVGLAWLGAAADLGAYEVEPAAFRVWLPECVR